MDGKNKGLLGAQALAGSVTVSLCDMTISGALGIIVSKAETCVSVLNSAKFHRQNGKSSSPRNSERNSRCSRSGLSNSKGRASLWSFVRAGICEEHRTGAGRRKRQIKERLSCFAPPNSVWTLDNQSTFDLSLLLTDSTGVSIRKSRRALSISRKARRRAMVI
jgi:hypothetical protein